MLAAAVASHASWLSHCNTDSIIGPDKLLATIKIVEGERKVVDFGWLLGACVLELVLELVLSCLHGASTSHTSADRTMEATCEPSASAAPPSVLCVGTAIGSTNCSHDQVDLAATKVAHLGPPDCLHATGRTQTTKVVGLDPVPLEIQDCGVTTAEPTQMMAVATNCDLSSVDTAAPAHFASANHHGPTLGDPAASTLEISCLTVRGTASSTTSTELPAPAIPMALIGDSMAAPSVRAGPLCRLQISELFAAVRATRAVSWVILTTPPALFHPIQSSDIGIHIDLLI